MTVVSTGQFFIIDVNDGNSLYTAAIYQQSLTQPNTPSGGTYNYASLTLTAPTNWSSTLPSATTTPTWVSYYTFSTSDKTATITASNWSVPTIYSQKGDPGNSAKTLTVSANRHIITFDNQGNASPADQTITFTATKQNTTAVVSWTVTNMASTPVAVTGQLSATTGDSVTMTVAQFNNARGTSEGVIVTATITDGVTLSESNSVAKTTAGVNAITVALNNPTHFFQSTADGTIISYTGSGSKIYVYDGPSELQFVTGSSTTTTGTWCLSSTTTLDVSTNLTVGSISVSGKEALLADYTSGTTSNTFSSSYATFTISGVTSAGVAFSNITAKQQLNKNKAGANAIDGSLSNTPINLLCDVTGSVISYSSATGNFKVVDGSSDVSANSTFSVFSQTNCTVTITSAGVYTVTNIAADTASAVLQAVYGSVTIKKTLSLTRTKNGTTIGVSLSNDTQTIPCDKNGAVVTGGYTGTGTNIYVYDGSVQLIYDANFSTNNTTGTYKVTASTASNITAGTIVSGGTSPNFYAVANDHTAITQNTASIIYTISGKNAAGSTFSTTKTQTFSKVLSGASGADAVTYYLKSDYYSLAKDDTNTYTPTTVTFNATSKTGATTATSYAGRFKIFENNSATASYTSAADESSYTYTPTTSCTSIKAILYLAGGTTTQIDASSVSIVISGSNATTAVLSNDSQSIPTDAAGNAIANGYVGSGTEIHVFEGSNELAYDGVGTSNGKWKVTAAGSSITVGSLSSSGTTPAYAIYGDHSAFTANTGSIKYTITGKTSTGKAFSIAKTQTFAKSKQGTDSVVKRIVLSAGGLSKSASNAFTPATVTISAQSVSGSGTPSTYAGRFKIFENNSVTASYTSAADESSYTYTPTTSCTSIQVSLYAAGGTTSLLDTQGVIITLNGIDGSTAALFRINNAGVTFTKNKSTISPTSVTLTTTYQNISGTITYQWQKNGSNIAGATSSSYTVNSTDFTNVQSATYTSIISGTINGSASSLNDSITIPRLDTGKDSVSVVASNENITFQAQSSGFNNILFTNGACDITVYIGSTALTYAASGANTFSCTTASTNATVAAGTSVTNTFTIPAPTAMSADYGYTDVSISVIDGDGVALSKTISKRISYSLSRNGVSSTTLLLSNESHTFPATYVGAVSSYLNSGTDIYVYEGSTALTYDGVGTTNGKWKVTATGTNITPGTITNNTTYATYGAHSGVANATDTSQIVYSISGVSSLGQSFALSKIQKFTKSKAGVDNITGYLTNESITLAADSNGNVSSYSGANGTFKVTNGITDVTTSSAFTVYSQTNTTISINATTGAYSITALSADYGSAVLQAVYSGVTLQKTVSLSKSKSGSNGSAALILKVNADKQTITYDSTGATLTPTTQTITFSTQKVNTTATVNWTLVDGSGVTLTPATYLSATSGNTITMTGANFTTARGSTSSVTVTGTLTDGSVTLSDAITIVMVKNGAKGDVGPTVTVTCDKPVSFTATDGVLDTSSGTTNPNLTFTANTTGMTSPTYAWSFSGLQSNPVASTTSTQVIASSNFGTSKSALITSTVTSNGNTYTDTVTITRLEKSTAAAGATVGASWGTNISGQPTSLAGINSTEGSKLTGIATGATNTYIDAAGNIQGVSSGAGTPVKNSLITAASIGAAATADLANKLNKTSADILSGVITVGTGGMFLAGTTTNGVYLGPSGIVGVSGGTTFFTIDTSGNGTFKGSLTGSSGIFGSASNGISLDGINGVLTVNSSGSAAVKYGYLSSSASYGIEGYNSSGTTVFKLDNVNGLDAKIKESALNLMGCTYRQKLIISGDYTLTVPSSGTTSVNIDIPAYSAGCYNIVFQITGYWENSGLTSSSAFMTYGAQGVYFNNATMLQAYLGTVNYISKDNTDSTNFPYTRGTVTWNSTLSRLQVTLTSRTGSSTNSGSLCKYSYIVWAIDNSAYPFTRY